MRPIRNTPSKDALPRLFAAQYAHFEDDLPLWIRLADAFGDPILELGCGSGRVLEPLQDAGHRVVGIDNDLGMLRLAQHRLHSTLEPGPLLVQADLRTFSLETSFRLVIISCNTFAELDEPMAQSALRRLRTHTAEDAALAIDLPNPLGWEQSEEEEVLMSFYDPISQHPIQLSASQHAPEEGSLVHVHWLYDELFPDGNVRRHGFSTTYHLRDPERMGYLLDQAGFRDLRVYGDYEFGPFAPDSDRMLILASPREGVLDKGG